MSALNQPFSPAPEPEGRHWTPIIAGAVVVALVIAAVVVFTRMSQSRQANPNDPYLAKLQLSNLHMATANNFAGTSVTYIEGTLTNTGDRKINSASVLVVFKNSLGEIAQREPLPVTVLIPHSPYVDYGTIDRAPLPAGQSRDFRLTLEYITPDWDGQIPQVKVASVGY
ncbi:MAG TPA: hypothetical protein VIX19_16540 [Terriglobales bacterium]